MADRLTGRSQAGTLATWGVAGPGRMLMAFSTREGQTRTIVDFMAGLARETGHAVDVLDLGGRGAGDVVSVKPAAVLLAASIHMGKHGTEVARWVRANRSALAEAPSALVSVSLSAAQELKRGDALRYVDELLAETGWRPEQADVVAGALRYTSYGRVKRMMMRKIADEGGLPTDASRDHVFTDWAEVAILTETFLRRIHAA